MTRAEMAAILDDIRYRPGWSLVSKLGEDWWLQWIIQDAAAPNGMWHCRKWRLSSHMTVSEVIQTAFLAVQVAEEHELRERFTYRGVAVLGPHWDLVQFSRLIERGTMCESTRMDPLHCNDLALARANG